MAAPGIALHSTHSSQTPNGSCSIGETGASRFLPRFLCWATAALCQACPAAEAPRRGACAPVRARRTSRPMADGPPFIPPAFHAVARDMPERRHHPRPRCALVRRRSAVLWRLCARHVAPRGGRWPSILRSTCIPRSGARYAGTPPPFASALCSRARALRRNDHTRCEVCARPASGVVSNIGLQRRPATRRTAAFRRRVGVGRGRSVVPLGAAVHGTSRAPSMPGIRKRIA